MNHLENINTRLTFTNGIADGWFPINPDHTPVKIAARVRLYNELDPAGQHHKPFYTLDGTIKWS